MDEILTNAWNNEDAQHWQVLGRYIDGEENAVDITLTEAEQKFIMENFDDDRIFKNFFTSGIAICQYDQRNQQQNFKDFLQREYTRASTDLWIYSDDPVCPIHNPGESKKDYHHKHLIVDIIKANSVELKNPSFSFEEEVRIIYHSDGFLNKRLIYIGDKPRIPTHIRNLRNLIKGVYISPHGDRRKNRKLAELFRDKYDLTFEIQDSYSSFIGD